MSDLSYTGADIDDISASVLFHDRQSGVTTTHNFRAGLFSSSVGGGNTQATTLRFPTLADC